MKKTYLFIAGIFLMGFFSTLEAKNYFVHAQKGNDKNSGTSPEEPLQSLRQASLLPLQAGDSLFLAQGQTFLGSLILEDLEGSPLQRIVITSYSPDRQTKESLAVIDAKGEENGILIRNCSFVQVLHLKIQAQAGGFQPESDMRCGVLVTCNRAGQFRGLYLDSLRVEDIFFEKEGFQRGTEEVRTANGRQRYGWGIRFINPQEDAVLEDLRVAHCLVQNVAHTGIKFTGQKGKNIRNIAVFDNQVLKSGGPGIQMSRVAQGHIRNNTVDQSGSHDDSRKWGRGSGLWTWGSSDVLIEKNRFLNAKGPGDSAGCHIDFNCRNVIVQYNLSANNAGGFCEILGNNYNCAYRYNISVNDGYRRKGQDGAFQEGKIFWLSGYQGNKKPRKGPFNSYFYNNTIYVKKEIMAKIAIDKNASGILIANNIFYLEGESKTVLGDQYKPEDAKLNRTKNVIFKNNVYLKEDNWPKDALIQDAKPSFGDPLFKFKGGLKLQDYLPANRDLIQDRGLRIPFLPQDSIGVSVGLKMKKDILGQNIQGLPDIGAIEIQ